MNADSHILQDEMMQQYTTMHSTAHTHPNTLEMLLHAEEQQKTSQRRDEMRREKKNQRQLQ